MPDFDKAKALKRAKERLRAKQQEDALKRGEEIVDPNLARQEAFEKQISSDIEASKIDDSIPEPEDTIAKTREMVTESKLEAARSIQLRQQAAANDLKQSAAEFSLADVEGREGKIKAIAAAESELNNLELEKQDFIDNHKLDIDNTLSLVEEERERLAGMSPKGFWKSADTQNKILMALSVMMGAVGQGLTGAKSNAALDMMNNVMDQHLNSQTALINRKFNALDKKAGSIKAKQDLAKQRIAAIEGQKKAIVDQLARTVEGLNFTTQNAQAKAKLQELLVSIDQERTKQDEDSFKAVNAMLMAEGAPIKKDEAKAAKWFEQFNPALARVEELEDSIGPGALAEVGRILEQADKEADIPFVGDVIGSIRTATGGTVPESAMAVLEDPRVIEYIVTVGGFSNAVLRDESGAAISVEEIRKGIDRFFSKPGETKKSLDTKRHNRRRELKAWSRQITGQPKGFWESK